MLTQLMAALKGLAALPKLVDAVNELGERLNRVAAQERLDEKKKRNRDVVRDIIERRVRRDKDGSGGGADKPLGL